MEIGDNWMTEEASTVVSFEQPSHAPMLAAEMTVKKK